MIILDCIEDEVEFDKVIVYNRQAEQVYDRIIGGYLNITTSGGNELVYSSVFTPNTVRSYL